MGKLFLSMSIGMALMLAMEGDAYDALRASALAAVPAFAQGPSR